MRRGRAPERREPARPGRARAATETRDRTEPHFIGLDAPQDDGRARMRATLLPLAAIANATAGPPPARLRRRPLAGAALASGLANPASAARASAPRQCAAAGGPDRSSLPSSQFLRGAGRDAGRRPEDDDPGAAPHVPQSVCRPARAVRRGAPRAAHDHRINRGVPCTWTASQAVHVFQTAVIK